MSKKQYEMLARLIGEARGTYAGAENYALTFFARELIEELKLDNPRFEQSKFWTAIRTYEAVRREFRARKAGLIA